MTYPTALGATLLALLFCITAGCSQTDEGEPDDTVQITVLPPEVGGISSRAIVTDKAFPTTKNFVLNMGLCLMKPNEVTDDGAVIDGYHNVSVLFRGNGTTLVPDGYVLPNGTAMNTLSVRKNVPLDIYGYYPHNPMVTDLNKIPFTAKQKESTLIGVSDTTDFPMDYMYIAPEHSSLWKNVPASDAEQLTPVFTHAMACYRLYLYNTSYQVGTGSNNTLSKTSIAYDSKSEATQEPRSHLWGIPSDGTYSAVDGSVHVTEWADTLAYDYTPRSFSGGTYIYFIFPEMIVGKDGYPDDAELAITIWLNETPTKLLHSTHTIKLSGMSTPAAAGATKGLVKGYMYSQTVYIHNHRQFEVSEMTIAPWRSKSYELSM